MNLLDSVSALNNFKNRNGFKISQASSVSIYSAQTNLRKMLTANLENKFSYKVDMLNFVDRIVDKCDDVETVNEVKEYFNNVSIDQFIESASKIKSFFRIARNFSA